MRRFLLLSFGLLVVASTALYGCSLKEAAKTPEKLIQQIVTTAPSAAYVGNDACKNCHTEIANTVAKTNHFSAFKPLSAYPLDKPLGSITVFDGVNKDQAKSATIDLSKEKVYGVMVDDYIIAEVPLSAGFKDKIYRIAMVKKVGDKWTIDAAKSEDVDKDGKPDWKADSFPCGPCHAPGIGAASKDLGISCESCHGPGGDHVKADNKKGTLNTANLEICYKCHSSNPLKDAQGNLVTDNHRGTRNFFASKHGTSSQLNGCLTCHSPHKANSSGELMLADKPADICAKCHAGVAIDIDKLMWKNPSDANNHITRDHSFGAIKYEELGDDKATKPIEITTPKVIELIKEKLPAIFK